jgi:outer membrane protein assembly factor BamE (lipoprotein component of BamABCDE complex)
MKRKTTLIVVLFLTISLLLTGCSKVNKENYQRLQTGMTYREVCGILGKPVRKGESLSYTTYTWRDKDKMIKVKFTNERVISFSKKGF